MKKYFIQTFWCAMNQADSEKINMILLQSWFFRANNWKEADLIIYNTCSVRQKGEDRVFGMIEEIKKENKKRTALSKKSIIVWITGCMVRKTGVSARYLDSDIKRTRAKKIEILKEEKAIFNNDDKLFPRSKTLDFALRIEDTKFLPLILTHIFKESIWVDHKFDDYLKSKQLRENPSQAIIIIQSGCDNYCSYCIVPYTRWKENSRSIEDILKESREAVKEWAKEITLVWQNVNSYGKQWVEKKYWNEEKCKWNDGMWKSPFRQLLEELDKIDWLDRIRFTSSNPHDMTRDILDAHFELNKTCNYLHFALQSWSDEMLKKMNRRHNYIDFKNMVTYLRIKDPMFSISTDIIVWYSWETENMFKQTLDTFEECEFDFTYNARYSVRKWTIAAKIYPDDVSNTTKAERWHILNDKLLENIEKRNKLMLDRVEEILVSGEKEWKFFGRTRNFKEIYFPKKDWIKIWDIVKVKLKELDRYIIKWEITN